MFRLFILILIGLAACAPTTTPPATAQRSASISLPPMKSFSASSGGPVRRSNTQIAQDFLELSFELETGQQLQRLTKFNGPIKVGISGQAPAVMGRQLDQLLGRLRREAGVPISRAARGETAQIVVEAVPVAELQRAVPGAACFIHPNVRGWTDFKRNRRLHSWDRIRKREAATVIIPSDVSSQEIRTCLHEEIAQALGPLNDLYRLADSTFNDDDFNIVLTGFDMLILRAYYSPEIRDGMTRAEAASVLPRVLSRINPRGSRGGGIRQSQTTKSWDRALTAARSRRENRASFARQALRIAQREGWRDNRLAYSFFIQGRTSIATEPAEARAAFLESAKIYNALDPSSIQSAHIGTQMAAFALSGGEATLSINIVDRAVPAVLRSQNGALLATLLLIKAEALDLLGRGSAARSVRNEALGWARYGFGSAENVRRRLDDIAALVPRQNANASGG